MEKRETSSEQQVYVPVALDAATVNEIHERLLSTLDEVEAGSALAVVELDGGEEVAPLALQLVVSAARTFPRDRVRFGPRATAALAALTCEEDMR